MPKLAWTQNGNTYVAHRDDRTIRVRPSPSAGQPGYEWLIFPEGDEANALMVGFVDMLPAGDLATVAAAQKEASVSLRVLAISAP